MSHVSSLSVDDIMRQVQAQPPKKRGRPAKTEKKDPAASRGFAEPWDARLGDTIEKKNPATNDEPHPGPTTHKKTVPIVWDPLEIPVVKHLRQEIEMIAAQRQELTDDIAAIERVIALIEVRAAERAAMDGQP